MREFVYFTDSSDPGPYSLHSLSINLEIILHSKPIDFFRIPNLTCFDSHIRHKNIMHILLHHFTNKNIPIKNGTYLV